MSDFDKTKYFILMVCTEVHRAIMHHFTCLFEALQALIYQLVIGLTGANGKSTYPVRGITTKLHQFGHLFQFALPMSIIPVPAPWLVRSPYSLLPFGAVGAFQPDVVQPCTAACSLIGLTHCSLVKEHLAGASFCCGKRRTIAVKALFKHHDGTAPPPSFGRQYGTRTHRRTVSQQSRDH